MPSMLSEIRFMPISEVYKNPIELFKSACESKPIIILKNNQPIGAIIAVKDLNIGDK